MQVNDKEAEESLNVPTEEAVGAVEEPLQPAAGGLRSPSVIIDYISGRPVKAGPEELEAVQVFSKRLVEELGYPKEQIQTRPQFRVRTTPSGDGGKTKGRYLL